MGAGGGFPWGRCRELWGTGGEGTGRQARRETATFQSHVSREERRMRFRQRLLWPRRGRWSAALTMPSPSAPGQRSGVTANAASSRREVEQTQALGRGSREGGERGPTGLRHRSAPCVPGHQLRRAPSTSFPRQASLSPACPPPAWPPAPKPGPPARGLGRQTKQSGVRWLSRL